MWFDDLLGLRLSLVARIAQVLSLLLALSNDNDWNITYDGFHYGEWLLAWPMIVVVAIKGQLGHDDNTKCTDPLPELNHADGLFT